ncbi:butyrophilin subfamily 2 member A2-like [Oryzias latipes]
MISLTYIFTLKILSGWSQNFSFVFSHYQRGNEHLQQETNILRMTLLLELILIFALQFEGASGKSETLYRRVGEEVHLHCKVNASSIQCSDVRWLYNRHRNTTPEVINEAGASRLSVSRNCSLLIRNITAEDAGRYLCQLTNGKSNSIPVFLKILSISKDPPEVHPRESGSVTLQCSLNRYEKNISCEQNIIWRNEAGSHLSGKNPEFEVKEQTNCVSVLTVKHQSGNNKRFTCQLVKHNKVKIDAVYVLTESPQSNTVIIIGAVVGVVLVLLVVVTVFLFRSRTAKATKDQKKGTNFQKPTHQNSELQSEPESDLTYAAVNYSKSKASSKITINAEEVQVIYSSIKIE